MKQFKIGQTIAKYSENGLQVMGEIKKIEDTSIMIDVIYHPNDHWLRYDTLFAIHTAHAQSFYTIISEPQ